MADQHAEVGWQDGDVPVSTRFDDPYFSLQDGLAECTHVFLAGNDLPARFRDGFVIAELGFGTGLNFLATWAAWQAAGQSGHLSFVSFEAFPMTAADMQRALAAFPGLHDRAAALIAAWPGRDGKMSFDGGVTLTVITGDARSTVPHWGGVADAWYLDGFSPAKNPELWGADLLQAVAAHTRPGGTFATYTAAGAVRRALTEAGFDVARMPGFGRKRHMTQGRRR